MLLILAECRRPNDLHLPARKGRLQDVRRIQRSLRTACADERMDLVNEKDDILRLDDIIHHIFEPLLKLATVLCSRDKCRHRKCDHAPVFEQKRHLPICNALGKPLGDRRLAHTCLTEENRVVLRTACENLNDAINLSCTPDYGIKPPRTGDTDQITPVLLE